MNINIIWIKAVLQIGIMLKIWYITNQLLMLQLQLNVKSKLRAGTEGEKKN